MADASAVAEGGSLRPAHWGGLALCALVFLWNSLYFQPHIVDDSFISLRYAHNLLTRGELVYNPGEFVEGYSNFSWVLIQAAVLALGLPPIYTLKALAMLCAAGVLVLTFRLAQLWLDGQPGATWISTAAVAGLAVNTSLAFWSQGGLETTWMALLVLAMVYRFELEMRAKRGLPLSAGLFALAWLTRPEAPIYLVYFALRRWRAGPGSRRSGYDRAWLLLFAGVVVPYELWGLWYFGTLLPNTHGAKVSHPQVLELGELFRHYSKQWLLRRFLLTQGWGLPALLVAAAVGILLARRRPDLRLLLVPLGGLVFVLYARFDWMPRHRFFVPILAPLAIATAFGVASLIRWASPRRWLALALSLFVLAAATDYTAKQLFFGSPVGTDSEKLPNRHRGWWPGQVLAQLGTLHFPLETSATALLAELPEHEAVCIRDIGFPGYVAMNPICDTAGLVSPEFAGLPLRPSLDDMVPVFEYLRQLKPGAFRLLVQPTRRTGVNERLVEWLESDPEMKQRYVRTTPLPEGLSRKESTVVEYFRRDLQAVDREARMAAALERVPEFRDALRAAFEP